MVAADWLDAGAVVFGACLACLVLSTKWLTCGLVFGEWLVWLVPPGSWLAAVFIKDCLNAVLLVCIILSGDWLLFSVVVDGLSDVVLCDNWLDDTVPDAV